MKQDVIGAAQLEIFAEIALFLFVLAFVVIVIRALTMSRDAVQEMEAMPLRDDTMMAHKEETHG